MDFVVFSQDKDEHLELMDGVLIDLLNAKWNTFVKSKFYKQFFTFAFYFLITLVCFTLRPGPPPKPAATAGNTTNATTHSNSTVLQNLTLTSLLNYTTAKLLNVTVTKGNDTEEESEMEEWWDNLTEECRLMKLDSDLAKIRLTAEVCMLLGAFAYLAAAVREARFLGGRMFFENLVISHS